MAGGVEAEVEIEAVTGAVECVGGLLLWKNVCGY